jgi:hypothetical protein
MLLFSHRFFRTEEKVMGKTARRCWMRQRRAQATTSGDPAMTHPSGMRTGQSVWLAFEVRQNSLPVATRTKLVRSWSMTLTENSFTIFGIMPLV